jgi:CRP-like cAMP-binding protein
MSLSPDLLRCIPFLRGLTDQQLMQLAGIFEQQRLSEGGVLFQAGMSDEAFYLLAEGEVSIFEGSQLRYQLRPPAPIGELGALANLTRNTTATISKPSEVWKVTRESLHKFFQAHGEIALLFYQNLMHLLADKVRRDQIRLEDMRHNIIRTQKAMKQMRDVILESKNTPISESLHNELEELIRHNRRVNYRVKPPDTMPANVRFSDGSLTQVVQISRTHVSFNLEHGDLPAAGDRFSGVLGLSGPELPISGKVLRTVESRVDLELDLLIDLYGSMLDGYLARVQMLDFMV